jgi:hypothetical protein
LTSRADGVNAKAMRNRFLVLAIVGFIAALVFAGPAPYEQSNTTLGQNGAAIYADTAAHTNTSEYAAFTVVSNAVFSAYNPNSSQGMTGSVAAVSFPAGLTVFGLFTNFTLSSGCIIVYKARAP